MRALARNYTCTNEQYIDALAAMTGNRARGWWADCRERLSPGLIELTELEHHAVALRVAVVIRYSNQ